MMRNQVTEVLPRTAYELWGLAKDMKKTKDAGKERTSTRESEGDFSPDLITPRR